MKHIHTFENFINEGEKTKVGRIVVKEKDALEKMSVEELKDLLKKVKDTVDKANSGWLHTSTAQEKSKKESISKGQSYAKDIIAILKEKGGIEKIDPDKIKEEIKSLNKEVEDLKKKGEPISKARYEASNKSKEVQKKEGATAEEIKKAKEEADKTYYADIDAQKVLSAVQSKIRDLEKKLKEEA